MGDQAIRLTWQAKTLRPRKVATRHAESVRHVDAPRKSARKAFDRKGNRIGIAGIPAPITSIGLSPDGKNLYADSEAGQLMMDAEGVGSAPLNLGPVRRPLWSPKGYGSYL
jgi:hypothetical protein